MRKPNTAGGGAATNRNGLQFERDTDLRRAFENHVRYTLRGDVVVDRVTEQEVGFLCEQHGLYSRLLKRRGVDWQTIISKRLLPDGAIVVADTLYIVEKKSQAGAGSVDEKLQTCHFKKRQYERLVASLGLRVEFYFLLNDWFRDPAYRDVLEYIVEVGCRYFFNEIPLTELGLLAAA